MKLYVTDNLTGREYPVARLECDDDGTPIGIWCGSTKGREDRFYGRGDDACLAIECEDEKTEESTTVLSAPGGLTEEDE